MAYDFYQSAALILRYIFAAAGVWIAGYALYTVLCDGRRARILRGYAHQTETLCILDERCPDRKTFRYLLDREGYAGAGSGCDIRISGDEFLGRHFHYNLTNGCLYVSALPNAEILDMNGQSVKKITLTPGASFRVGQTRFRFRVMRVVTRPLSPDLSNAYGSRLPTAMKPAIRKRRVRNAKTRL